jgi:replicative DNA helicase
MNAANSRFAWNKVQEVSEISKWLKELARELEVPIIALSQLSRKVEERTDKRPWLSDLRESGSIEQDADTVIMIYREDYYDQDTERQWTADILVRKNRNWPTWEIEFKFEKAIMKFMETDKWVWLWE